MVDAVSTPAAPSDYPTDDMLAPPWEQSAPCSTDAANEMVAEEVWNRTEARQQETALAEARLAALKASSPAEIRARIDQVIEAGDQIACSRAELAVRVTMAVMNLPKPGRLSFETKTRAVMDLLGLNPLPAEERQIYLERERRANREAKSFEQARKNEGATED